MGTGVGVPVPGSGGVDVSSGVGASVDVRVRVADDGSVGDAVAGAAGSFTDDETPPAVRDLVTRGVPVGAVVDCGSPVGVPVGVGAVAGVPPIVGVRAGFVRRERAFEVVTVSGTAEAFPPFPVPAVTHELAVRSVTFPAVRRASSPASEAHPAPTSRPPTPTAPRRTSCRFMVSGRYPVR